MRKGLFVGRTRLGGPSQPHIVGSVLVGVLLLLLTACGTAFQPVATIDELAGEYVAPGGVFTLPLPQGWLVGDLSADPALLLTFAPPRAEYPLLTVYTVRLGSSLADVTLEDMSPAVDGSSPGPSAAFVEAVAAYRQAPYNNSLTVLDQAEMADGSVRIAGIRATAAGAVPVNVFVQADGAFFSALEVLIPTNDDFMAALLTLLVNGYAVDAAAVWPVGTVDALPAVPDDLLLAAGNLTFGALATWVGDDGRLHVTGQVANQAPYPVEAVTVNGQLLDGTGLVLEEVTAAIPLTVLPDGELSPFELVWVAGDLPITVRYRLAGQAQQAADSLRTVVGPGAFDWEDRAEYDEAGRLHIRGTVWNVSAGPVYAAQAVVTLFDGSDRVLGVVVADIGNGALGAGDSVRFDAPVSGEGGIPVRYQLTMTGRSQP